MAQKKRVHICTATNSNCNFQYAIFSTPIELLCIYTTSNIMIYTCLYKYMNIQYAGKNNVVETQCQLQNPPKKPNIIKQNETQTGLLSAIITYLHRELIQAVHDSNDLQKIILCHAEFTRSNGRYKLWVYQKAIKPFFSQQADCTNAYNMSSHVTNTSKDFNPYEIINRGLAIWYISGPCDKTGYQKVQIFFSKRHVTCHTVCLYVG